MCCFFRLTDGGSVEFFIPGDGQKYIDLNVTLLHLHLKIFHVDGLDLANDAAMAVLNYPLNTFFNQCILILGDGRISQSGQPTSSE